MYKNIIKLKCIAALLLAIGVAGCQTTSKNKSAEPLRLADYALVVCSKNGAHGDLLKYKVMGRRPHVSYKSDICNGVDYQKGEIAGYLTDSGNYFSGLKGEFHIFCAKGFIALGDPYKVPEYCKMS